MTLKYLEDFVVGQKIITASHKVTARQIIAFAQVYDPQPFHTDEQQAQHSFFKGLVASGWHTASLTMKLIVASEAKPADGLIGASIDKLRFYQPVRPNDTIHASVEVLATQVSRSKPAQGVVTIAVSAFNQREEQVCRYISAIVVPTGRV
ncbi:MaoC family dehydratase [Thalassotalea euphylliae]|uniref:MaoC family dehydratase n=1 Tax=Thalassotalea euphylliae TaxID=1655234 RepID=A0A3E0TLY5_9GAMM|nr:MaoC family dehydratase [Thalassotalea euphylliae]REL25561.1 MaoC family dehydratase [Thalassotalea euphylliae]